MPFRIVVCIDVDATDLEQAYGRVSDNLGKLPDGMDWESTDEWYDDGDGDAIDEEEIQRVRMATFAKKEE